MDLLHTISSFVLLPLFVMGLSLVKHLDRVMRQVLIFCAIGLLFDIVHFIKFPDEYARITYHIWTFVEVFMLLQIVESMTLEHPPDELIHKPDGIFCLSWWIFFTASILMKRHGLEPLSQFDSRSAASGSVVVVALAIIMIISRKIIKQPGYGTLLYAIILYGSIGQFIFGYYEFMPYPRTDWWQYHSILNIMSAALIAGALIINAKSTLPDKQVRGLAAANSDGRVGSNSEIVK